MKCNTLALFGGSPVLAKPFPVWTWPPCYEEMGKAVANYVSGNQPLSIQGRDGVIADCEDLFNQHFHRKHSVLCSSGTMALYSAYFALNVKPGDEIICTTITYHATATAALHLGALVRLVDVEPETGNIDIDRVADAINHRTVAVASNAMWGHPVDQFRLRHLCDRHRIAWIEDFSHAHFSSTKTPKSNNTLDDSIFETDITTPVGSLGDISCCSLQGNKFVTGGEAGILLTNSDEFHDRAVLLGHNLLRSQTCVIDPNYAPISRTGYGLKLRCHPLAAVMIREQLNNHVNQWISERTDSLTRLSDALRELPEIRPPVIREYVSSMGAWYGYKPWIDWSALNVTRERVVMALRAENLDVDIPGSPALHRMSIFDPDTFPILQFEKYDNRGNEFPNADSYSKGTLSLPTFTGLRDEVRLQSMIEGFQKVWSNLELLG